MEENKQKLYQFLNNQNIFSISTVDENNSPWICTVYCAVDENLNLYFMSPLDTDHSKHILRTGEIAFSTAWSNPNDLSNRKGIQGKANVEIIEEINDSLEGYSLIYKKFSNWEG
ncbi:MAG: pyridoxamine 5'-phosphate oxidase family protein [Candidatus Dojkabacteria bacterium]|nr:pyridoxamine 5'-phosphate oxidase family protein [Candidatus Dojkabacteria bacterium]MDQ7021853.1 pyridoxamine 5'-phosphate oxidase family protein [Candidatus Dojkabacteria bacterium]